MVAKSTPFRNSASRVERKSIVIRSFLMLSGGIKRDQTHEKAQEAQNDTGKRNIKEGPRNLSFQ